MNEIEKAQQKSQEALLSASKIIFKASEAINKAFKDVRFASEELEERLSELSKPVEREYRAGEWVPEVGKQYFIIDSDGTIFPTENDGHRFDAYRFRYGNAFPDMGIAEAAKEHADWWREFDMTDEGGGWELYAYQEELNFWYTKGNYGNPKYLSEDSARAAIDRLGGGQKVIEMLNKGRVFRFKWGGQ